MGVSRRKDTGKWGYRHYYHGKNYRKHDWDRREEAVNAFNGLLDKLRRKIPVTDSNIYLVEAVNEFMKYSKRVGKSENRLLHLYLNFEKVLITFLGDSKRLRDITHLNIESFIDDQMKRPIKKAQIKMGINGGAGNLTPISSKISLRLSSSSSRDSPCVI